MKLSNKFSLGLMAGGVLLASGAVQASAWADKTTISGFSSAVFQISDSDVSFNGTDDNGIVKKGSFNGTRFGMNLNSQINDRVSLSSQLVSSRENDNYNSKVDWAFITFQVTDELSIRTGKVKYPVGLSNEYVSVGYGLPWITAPQVFYAVSPLGPQVTRDAYTGGSFLLQKDIGDTLISVDLFGGEVELGNMTVHALKGITMNINWNDSIVIQGSSYKGTMENEMMAAMDGESHGSNVIGIKLDLADIMGYAEYAQVDMGDFKAGKGTSWYTSVGYRMGDFLPYFNYGMYEKGKDAMVMMGTTMMDAFTKQYVATAGMRYDIARDTDIKFEVSKIRTSMGNGLFESSGADADVTVYGIAVDVVF